MKATGGRFIVATMIALAVGCGPTHEEKVCREVVDLFTEAMVACGYPEDEIRATLLHELNDCENVAAIRDEDALYDDCLPSIATADCTDLMSGFLPPSCHDQILF